MKDSERDKRFTSAFQMSTEPSAKANARLFHKSERRIASGELTLQLREKEVEKRDREVTAGLCLFRSKC